MSLQSQIAQAQENAKRQASLSIENLRSLLRVQSPTGEELAGQEMTVKLLQSAGAIAVYLDLELEDLFERFPTSAQYPTHWQHDLILPYEDLPTMEALRASGLENVLNYRQRPNVVGRWPGTGGGRSLILNGHVDTVTVEPVSEWSHDPYGAELVGDQLFGRGASDMKGGVVAAIMAMHFLHEAGVELRGDVIFQSVVNEEHAGNGTLDLVRRGITADAAIVLEPTNSRIMTGHPGGLYWQITVPGVQRSPGARWRNGSKEGVSAIENLVPVINELLALEESYNSREDLAEPENGRAAFALVMGKIVGGHYDAATAGSTIIRGSVYFTPAVGDVTDVMEAFRGLVAKVSARDPFLAANPIKVEFLHHDDSTLQDTGISIATELNRVLASRGQEVEVKAGPFACDMRHLVNRGKIPSVIYGPGDIAQAHKPDEYISITEFLESIQTLIAFLPAWCNGTPAELDEPSPERASLVDGTL